MNKIVIIGIIIAIIGTLMPYAEVFVTKEFPVIWFISSILILLGNTLIDIYHRGHKITKIFNNATEKEKDEIYNFVKKYEKVKK